MPWNALPMCPITTREDFERTNVFSQNNHNDHVYHRILCSWGRDVFKNNLVGPEFVDYHYYISCVSDPYIEISEMI